MRFFKFVIFILPFFATAAMQIGGGTGGNDYWSPLRFKDAMKQAGQWKMARQKVILEGGQVDRSGIIDIRIPLVHEQYPSQLPYLPEGVTNPNPGEYGDLFFWRAYAMVGVIKNAIPLGTYTLRFKGTGMVRLFWQEEAEVNSNPNAQGYTEYEFDVTEDNVQTMSGLPASARRTVFKGFAIGIMESDANDPVHDVQLIIPDEQGGTSFNDENLISQPFNPQWLDKAKLFNPIRTMNWDNVNNCRDTVWSERRKRSETAQGDQDIFVYEIEVENSYSREAYIKPKKATAYEYTIELANLTQNDIWLNIPVYAPYAYIDSMAAFFGRHYPENLNLYLEWGNEVWNPIFIGYPARIDRNEAEKGFAHSQHFTTYITGYANNAFRQAWAANGKDSTRIRPVLSGQSTNVFHTKMQVEGLGIPEVNPWNYKPYAVATAPYFNSKTHLYREHKAIADSLEIKLVMYESGSSNVPMGAENIARTITMYQNALELREKYFDMFQQFCIMARMGGGGLAGGFAAIEYPTQPLEDAPKYKVVLEYAEEAGQFNRNVWGTIDYNALAKPILGLGGTSNISRQVQHAKGVPTVNWNIKNRVLVLNGIRNSRQITVFSLSGKIVKSLSLQDKSSVVTLDLNILPSGLYQVKINETVNQTFTVILN